MPRQGAGAGFDALMKTVPATALPLPHTAVSIATNDAVLEGNLSVPPDAAGVVIFAHGSGSSRHSPRNRQVAEVFRAAGLGTLLVDLLTPEEERRDRGTAILRFDVDLLAQRLIGVARWLESQPETHALDIGFFGASTGGGAALMAAAALGDHVGAVVCRGGRPDLAGNVLPLVRTPTLLLVGGKDEIVIGLNEMAFQRLRCEKKLRLIPGATHLFEEPGCLDEVARLSARWFNQHLVSVEVQKEAA